MECKLKITNIKIGEGVRFDSGTFLSYYIFNLRAHHNGDRHISCGA